MKISDEYDVAQTVGVNQVDWKEYSLRAAYAGILDDEAMEYELGRYRGLEEVKRRKMSETLQRYTYNKTAQVVARTAVICLAYLHAAFGIPRIINFLLGLFILGRKHLPRSRLGKSKVLSALLLTPAVLSTLYASFLLLRIWLNRMWLRDPGLVIIMSLGFLVIFLSLAFG